MYAATVPEQTKCHKKLDYVCMVPVTKYDIGIW